MTDAQLRDEKSEAIRRLVRRLDEPARRGLIELTLGQRLTEFGQEPQSFGLFIMESAVRKLGHSSKSGDLRRLNQPSCFGTAATRERQLNESLVHRC